MHVRFGLRVDVWFRRKATGRQHTKKGAPSKTLCMSALGSGLNLGPLVSLQANREKNNAQKHLPMSGRILRLTSLEPAEVWPRAEGDEDMVAALEQLVQAHGGCTLLGKCFCCLASVWFCYFCRGCTT